MLKRPFRSDLRFKSQLVAEDKEGLFVCAEEQTTIETTSKRETEVTQEFGPKFRKGE